MRRWTWWIIGLLAVGAAASADARVFGEKKKGSKGRYLEVEDGISLADYRGAWIVLDPAEITSDKDKPVDTESVRATSDDALREHLKASGVFGKIVQAVPTELPAGVPVIRIETHLTLQHGSQAMRFFAGGGAGKSKLHIRVGLTDVRSGERLAEFNGYGTGAGLWSLSGGGVQRMARDDLKESYGKLEEYLVRAVE